MNQTETKKLSNNAYSSTYQNNYIDNDKDLALIGFPAISSEKLVKEVNKEMRVTRNDFISELLSLERVVFFEKDIDESLTGKKVVTTSNPDTNKTTLPSEKLCMVMGLGPKGLPKSYING